MDDSQTHSVLMYRKTHRVRGPRPCSWISSSSDSSLNDHRDVWPWALRRPGLCQGYTLRSTTPTESSDSSISSPTLSPVHTSKVLLEDSEGPYYRHARRQKPAGPRAPRNSARFDVRPRLVINTSLPVIPQLQQEDSPTTPPVQSADTFQTPHIPPLIVHSPTNFLLDWDAIFELLGCSQALTDSAGPVDS